MEIKPWISLLLLIGVYGFDHFQLRAIYYSESDNVATLESVRTSSALASL
jgi:hypothetical protein